MKAANARIWGLPLRSDGNRYTVPPISAPTVGAVVNSSSQITVTASGAASSLGSIAGYRYRRNGVVVNQTPSGSPLVDTGLFASTQYFYTATAVDSVGNESVPATVVSATTQSSADTTAPTAPAITATALSASTIRIALTVASTDSGGSGFRDYTLQSAIAAAGPFTDLVTAMAGAAFPYTHSGLPGSTTRYYRLRAFDNAGNSSASAVVNATTSAAAGQWQAFSDPQFQFGIPSSWNFGAYAPPGASNFIIGTAGQQNTPNVAKSAELSARGITLDVTGRSLVYDGVAAIGNVSAVILEDIPPGGGEASAAADWSARIAGPGVVWYHNFESAAEVSAFRWSLGFSGGNDPNANGSGANNVRWESADGVAGGCLECFYPAGSSPNSVIWWRPFSPMNAGNGRGASDPGAAGTLSPQAWAPTNGGSQLSGWNRGWYGHPSYQSSPYFDGHDFYVQLRVKADPRRITGGNAANTVGKFVWFSTAEGGQSLSNGELVTYSYGDGGNQGAHNYLRMYTLGRTGAGAFDPLNDGARIQVGSDVSQDWYYSGGWDTLLYHIRPGQIGVTSGVNSTKVEVWAAHQGETSYTKIWNQEYGLNGYEARNGLQALLLSAYNNGRSFPQAFWHRYCQVIFSRQAIPCPQV